MRSHDGFSYSFYGERTGGAGVEESLVGHFQPLPPLDFLTHAYPFAICPLIANPPQIACPWGWLEGDLAARLASIFLAQNQISRRKSGQPETPKPGMRPQTQKCTSLFYAMNLAVSPKRRTDADITGIDIKL